MNPATSMAATGVEATHRLGSSAAAYGAPGVTDDQLLALLRTCADAVRDALASVDDWGLAGTRAGQYRSDLAADRAALDVLAGASVGVLSEETGMRDGDRDVVVVVDPLDGSSNAHRGVPWFATSLCAVERGAPRVAVVRNLATGATFEAVRGHGATLDSRTIAPSSCTHMRDAFVGLSGLPPQWLGWKQYRALGAAALDLCAVACGVLDAYIDCSPSAHGCWDYVGGLLVCEEAGAHVRDAQDRDLVVLDHAARRTPVAAATSGLLDEALRARSGFA
jgi:myo-inositol-1(or 4)-monophosphatase